MILIVRKFISWLRDLFFPEIRAALEQLTQVTAEFEWLETGYFDLRDQESQEVQAGLDKAWDLRTERSEDDAFVLYREMAEAGSPTAACMVAWCLQWGEGTDADPIAAMDWYFKAIEGGSWLGTIEYAKLLDRLGYYDTADEVLADGISAGLATAYYTQAKLKYERSPSRASARSVRPLLDRAIALGHPYAEYFLMRLQFSGKFGAGEVRTGIRWSSNFMARYRDSIAGSDQSRS